MGQRVSSFKGLSVQRVPWRSWRSRRSPWRAERVGAIASLHSLWIHNFSSFFNFINVNIIFKKTDKLRICVYSLYLSLSQLKKITPQNFNIKERAQELSSVNRLSFQLNWKYRNNFKRIISKQSKAKWAKFRASNWGTFIFGYKDLANNA